MHESYLPEAETLPRSFAKAKAFGRKLQTKIDPPLDRSGSLKNQRYLANRYCLLPSHHNLEPFLRGDQVVVISLLQVNLDPVDLAAEFVT